MDCPYVHVLKKGCKSIKILSNETVSFKGKKQPMKQAGGFVDPLLSIPLLLIMRLLVKQGWTMRKKISGTCKSTGSTHAAVTQRRHEG